MPILLKNQKIVAGRKCCEKNAGSEYNLFFENKPILANFLKRENWLILDFSIFFRKWYKIDITDHLSRTSPIEVLETDHTGLRAIGVSNPEQFDQIQYFVNDFDTTTQGIDVVANYSMELFNGDTQLSFI